MLIPTMGDISYEARSMYLCVDKYELGEIGGRFYSAFEDKAYDFHSLLALIGYVDNLLDDTMYSQRYEERRALMNIPSSRRERTPRTDWKEFKCPAGAVATFVMRIHFRQNATWQGEVTWMDNKQTSFFRSALELFRMIDDVLLSEQVTETPISTVR